MNSNLSKTDKQKVVITWWMLKLTYGLVFIVAGADKFIGFITEWQKYVSPLLLQYLPFTSTQIVYASGVFEIILGLLILSKLTKIGAYLTSAWLFLIAINLFSMYIYLDIVVRDIVMAISAIALGQLTDIKD